MNGGMYLNVDKSKNIKIDVHDEQVISFCKQTYHIRVWPIVEQ